MTDKEKLAAIMPLLEEPTEEMLNAAFDATTWPDDMQISADTWRGIRENMRKEYKAMIKAADIIPQIQKIVEG